MKVDWGAKQELIFQVVKSIDSPQLLSFGKIFILCTLIISPNAFSQWRKIFDFGSPIMSIHFKEFSVTPEDGFVGIREDVKKPNNLWRTIDAGKSWQKILYPANSSGIYEIPYSFAFKNSFEGWLSSFGGSVIRTVDGGGTWSVTDPNFIDAQAISYVKSSNRLITASTIFAYHYSTDGINFTGMTFPGFMGGVSVTFNGDYGILSSLNPVNEGILYTEDGGLNWNLTSMLGEFFQPLGIPNTKTFFALCEACIYPAEVGKLIRSDDGGKTWTRIYTHSFGNDNVTGTLQCGKNMALFFQAAWDRTEGIMMSDDSGYSFYSICGPSSEEDTRFYVRDTFIYAGDRFGGLWLNTTGIGSNSKPILSSDTIIYKPASCEGESHLITITLFDSCNNRQAQLLSTSLSSKSPVFTIASGGLPHTIHPEDSLVISYLPDSASNGNDTGYVHLQFKLGWKTFDTTIVLLGEGSIIRDSLVFIPSISRNNINKAAVTNYQITPSKAISGKNLSEVAFDVTLDEDLLEVRNISTPNGLNLVRTQTVLPNGVVTRHIMISGTDIALDPASPIANFELLTYITDTLSTPISLSNIKLNGFDPDYERCTLSARGQDTTFTLAFLCGDRTIHDFMRHGRSAIEIVSIRPNPARDEVVVEIVSEVKEVTVEVYDVIGKLVQTLSGEAGAFSLPVHLLSPGNYVLRVTSGGEVASRGFVVER